MARPHDRQPIVIDDDIDEPDVVVIDGDSPSTPRNTSGVAKDLCKDGVKAVFPNICLEYLEHIIFEHSYNSDAVIGAILDLQEKGESYPVRLQDNPLKRKRAGDGDDDDDDEDNFTGKEVIESMRKRIAAPDYITLITSPAYEKMARSFLAADFPKAPMLSIRDYLLMNKRSLFEAYMVMDEAVRNWNEADPPWKEKKLPSCGIGILDVSSYSPEEQAAIIEVNTAREVKAIKDARVAVKVAAEAEEERNFAHAKLVGQTTECVCCFDEFPLNRMIQCNGEPVHWFCRGCMRSQTETNIGLSKHELTCMSMDGCSAGFSFGQKKLFLDKKLRIALEGIEQEALLRMAGIEDLETCPFCPYAAEYPPVEVNKEFRCVNPGCEKVSCRLCRKETHIPKTCAESAADHGLDARHVLEEAMSAALIRTCNQCKNPFLKLDGCNKIRCTRCKTTQCYVCRQTITGYKHFDDVARGGKNGHCPLYDESTEERHQQEVQRAEEETRQKVEQENPDVSVDALKIHVSEDVQKDEIKRKEKRYRNYAYNGHANPANGGFPAYNQQVGGPHHGFPVPGLPWAGAAPVPRPAPAPRVIPVPNQGPQGRFAADVYGMTAAMNARRAAMGSRWDGEFAAQLGRPQPLPMHPRMPVGPAGDIFLPQYPDEELAAMRNMVSRIDGSERRGAQEPLRPPQHDPMLIPPWLRPVGNPNQLRQAPNGLRPPPFQFPPRFRPPPNPNDGDPVPHNQP